MRVVRQSSRLRPLGGLALLAIGAAAFLSATRAGVLSEGVVAAAAGALFTWGGWSLLTDRRALVIDPDAGQVIAVSGRFGAHRTVYALADLDRVTLALLPSSEGDDYEVQLVFRGAPLSVRDDQDEASARRLAVELAGLLHRPFHDAILQRTHAPGRLGETLAMRVEREGLGPAAPEPELRTSRVARSGSTIRISMPLAGRFDTGLFGATLLIGVLLVAAAAHPTLLFPAPAKVPLGGRLRFGGAMAAAPPLLFLLHRLWSLFQRTVVEADRSGLTVYRRGLLLRTGRVHLAAGELTDLCLVGGGITAVTAERTVRLEGEGLPAGEWRWLHRELTQTLTARR